MLQFKQTEKQHVSEHVTLGLWLECACHLSDKQNLLFICTVKSQAARQNMPPKLQLVSQMSLWVWQIASAVAVDNQSAQSFAIILQFCQHLWGHYVSCALVCELSTKEEVSPCWDGRKPTSVSRSTPAISCKLAEWGADHVMHLWTCLC